jgi:beta-xylosidase
LRTLTEIQIRDPFVLPIRGRSEYFLFGSTDKNVWHGPGVGFDAYRSSDLVNWNGPIPAFRPLVDFWGKTQFWAPEVHEYRGKYYMFATFKAHNHCRGTQILCATEPQGPYHRWSDGPVTPRDWESLDGTLHLDGRGQPWMIFCHEWAQIGDGTMNAIRLSSDLRSAVGEPIRLFSASHSPWVRPIKRTGAQKVPGGSFVTDGPFLHRTTGRTLLMLWSSFGDHGYAMGIARSSSGAILGPWTHDPKPLWNRDGGHGMIFRDLSGRLHITLHQPNETPNERAAFFPLEESGDQLRIGQGPPP